MASKLIIQTDSAPKAIGPYSQAVKVGEMLFCSGQICLDPATGNLVNQSIEAETEQVMDNIGALLKAAGMDYSNVVKATIFMRDMGDYSRINAVYARYFTASPPAREAVAVKTLPKEVGVEISVIAAE